MLYELLPLLKGWKIYPKDLEASQNPIPIKQGKTYELIKATKPGWIIAIQVSFIGPPDTQFYLEFYDPLEGYKKATISPGGLLTLGFDMPNPSSAYLVTYDLDENFYCIAFTPSYPFPFFASESKPARIAIEAPKTAPVYLTGYAQSIILIADAREFRNSLMQVLGAKIPEVLREEFKKIQIVERGEDISKLAEEVKKEVKKLIVERKEDVRREDISKLTEEVKKLREVGERIAEQLSPERVIEKLRKPPWEVIR